MTKASVLVTLACALLLWGCGGASSRISAKKGPMPQGGTFTGVWFSPEYGEMHLHQNGNKVVGWYQQNERVGRIHGTVSGNILRFEFEEKREMVVGKPTTFRGEGYFAYILEKKTRGESSYEVHRLDGEWWVPGSGDTSPWTATKSKKRQPEMQPPRGAD